MANLLTSLLLRYTPEQWKKNNMSGGGPHDTNMVDTPVAKSARNITHGALCGIAALTPTTGLTRITEAGVSLSVTVGSTTKILSRIWGCVRMAQA